MSNGELYRRLISIFTVGFIILMVAYVLSFLQWQFYH
jgi:hypothetical protein